MGNQAESKVHCSVAFKEDSKEDYKPIEYKIGVPYKDDTPDYHFMCDEWMLKEERRKRNMGDIYANAIVCLECGDYIRSRNCHDYRTCSCGACAVDGGSWYTKRGGKPSSISDRTVLFEDVREED